VTVTSQEVVAQEQVPSPPREFSAERFLTSGQAWLLAGLTALLVTFMGLRLTVGFGPSLHLWEMLLIDALTVLNFVILGYRLVLMRRPQQDGTVRFGPGSLTMPEGGWPRYTVLVPVYKEGRDVMASLVANLKALDYPADKLDIRLLVEEDDDVTPGVLEWLSLPSWFTVVSCPVRKPKTKPGACNIGLVGATGTQVVIYDAEDRPDPDQLKKAAVAFAQLPDRVVCVQAQLHYHNPETNWLTRCFAAEYALHFALVLFGLQRVGGPIPLGGTSNHFRMSALLQLGAWDKWNVAEDAELGMRIARRGWETQMMDSVTHEEANSRLGNWIRQRSRWIKGYMQTWLVHMRNPWRLWRDLGTKQFVSFQLVVGFMTVATVINPLFWALTGLYVAARFGGLEPVTLHIESLFPPAVLILGTISLIGGNLLVVYMYMTGCMQRKLYGEIWYMFFVPVYWLLMSVAAFKAVSELLRPKMRSYWQKTDHGLVAAPPAHSHEIPVLAAVAEDA
jgi:cellulose synthase/poly-beta-1,6-N-acetylglucosamine synthase-like glycosyltransferase